MRAELAAESLPSVRVSKTHREQQPLRKGAHFVLGYRNADSTAKGQHPAVCGAVPEQHELRLGAGRGVRSISGSLGPAPGTSFWFTLIFFSHAFFAPARFLSGQHGLREPKGYTLLLRLGSRRQAARPFGLGRSSTRSSGGPSTLVACGGWGHGWPRAVLATACCTATDSMLWPAELAVLCKTVVEPGLVPNGAHRR